MDIRIGLANTARELSVEIDDADAPDVMARAEAAAAGDSSMLWIEDRNGRRVGVCSEKLAYVEFGPTGDRRIGFAAG